MKTIICPQCKHRTPDDRQFCQICLFNVHYQQSFGTITRPPWESKVDVHKLAVDADANVAYAEHIDAEKKKWTQSGSWARWEKSRKAKAMANKPEWIKRGAKVQERDEAIKG